MQQRIVYRVFASPAHCAYGIIAYDPAQKTSAITPPFWKSRRAASRVAFRLSRKQVPIHEFKRLFFSKAL
jgi:hypothetical protein